MESKKNWDITTVRHLLMRSGEIVGHFNSDMVFIDNAPYLVCQWAESPTGESYPEVTIRLDPKHLHQLGWPDAQCLYEVPVEDPRHHN